MKQYTTKSGKQRWMPSFEEVEQADADGLGFCLACGDCDSAEPDARRYECATCGEHALYGAAELALMGLCHAS